MPSTTLPEHGFCHMPRQTIIKICGADRVSFLHNFCTNDIKQLTNEDSCELFITTVQGRCVGYATVTALEDSLVLATAPGQSEAIVEHLSKYIITEDVSFVDLSEYNAFLLTSTGDTSFKIGKQDNGNIILACHWMKANAVWVFSDDDQPAEIQGRESFSPDQANAQRIENRIPVYGLDVCIDNLPHEIQRTVQAINFNKGCYLGQEPIARIDALGHVNWMLVLIQFSTEVSIAPHANLTVNDKVVAKIGSVQTVHNTSERYALALVRRELAVASTDIQTDQGDIKVI
jgi:folate-binding protein YgfZ